MLAHAQELYGGELEITGHSITQGSYSDAVGASFGTHAGGGAVDLSVLRRGTYTVLWDDLEPLIRALRAAGFAAWVREYGELHADSAYPYPCHCNRRPGTLASGGGTTYWRGGLFPRL